MEVVEIINYEREEFITDGEMSNINITEIGMSR
jgi:hypothetical protein